MVTAVAVVAMVMAVMVVVMVMMVVVMVVIIIIIHLKVLQLSLQFLCSFFLLLHASELNRLLQAFDVDLVLDHLLQ